VFGIFSEHSSIILNFCRFGQGCLPFLQWTHQCYLVDLPGHGKNLNDGYFSFDDSIMEIEKLIAKNNKDSHRKVNIISHSLGVRG
jgi:pimeloyl-ACP methyl ester carboxylesterase